MTITLFVVIGLQGSGEGAVGGLFVTLDAANARRDEMAAELDYSSTWPAIDFTGATTYPALYSSVNVAQATLTLV